MGKIATGILILIAVGGCGGGGDNEFATKRAADGSCPVPQHGAYEAATTWGANGCGNSPGSTQKETVFVGGDNDPMSVVHGAVEDPVLCVADVDADSAGVHFQGSFEYASATKFRFVGTVNDGTCSANVTITWTKR